MMHWDDTRLVGVLFHELAHQVLYIKDDTAFNESFATAVEQEGFRRWQTASGDLKSYENWLRKRQRRQQFIKLVSKYRAKLEELYQDGLPQNENRNQKAAIFNQLKSEFSNLKSIHSGLAAYNAWFKQPLNNAKLISVSTYHNWVPAFGKILSESGGDLDKFFRICRQLAKKEPSERNRILSQFTDSKNVAP